MEIKNPNPPPLIFSQNPSSVDASSLLCIPSCPRLPFEGISKNGPQSAYKGSIGGENKHDKPENLDQRAPPCTQKFFVVAYSQPVHCPSVHCPDLDQEETANFAKRNTDKIFMKNMQFPRQLLSKGDLCYYKYNLQDYIFLIIFS